MANEYLPGVVSHQLSGVAVERHQLDVEVHRLAHMLRSVGVRAQRALRDSRSTPDEPAKPLPEGCLELLEWHAKTTKWLLSEQRMRAAMRPGTGLEAMTDAQYDYELKALAREALLDLPDGDLTGLLAERDARRR